MCNAVGCGNVRFSVGGLPDPSLVKGQKITNATAATAKKCYFPDPRFTTEWSMYWPPNPPWFYHPPHNTLKLPASAVDKEECWDKIPGYWPQRPDKGYKLTVNDYPYHNINLFGKGWDDYVYRRRNY